MGERKVLNKYYPPDFDPSLIPRFRRQKNQQITVRMMLPMNVQCTSCGEFMYAGKKFNSKKECALGEDYLGILVGSVCACVRTVYADPFSVGVALLYQMHHVCIGNHVQDRPEEWRLHVREGSDAQLRAVEGA